MLRSLMILLTFILLGLPQSEAADQQPYTNADIEKYRSPSDGKPAQKSVREAGNEKQERTDKIREEREKEYWCKRAAPYRKKVQRAGEDLREAEAEESQAKSAALKKGKSAGSHRKRVEKCRKRLRQAEEDLSDIESEAYRKGVPMGWLRCQFE